MPFPGSLTLITLTGSLLTGEGNPRQGTVVIRLPAPIRSQGDNVIVPPFSLTAELDDDGAFTVQVPATTDPDWIPNGAEYVVQATFSDFSKLWWSFPLPHTTPGAALDLADVGDPNVGTPTSGGQAQPVADGGYKGAWAPGTLYRIGDTIQYGSSAYGALKPSTAVTPGTDVATWSIYPTSGGGGSINTWNGSTYTPAIGASIYLGGPTDPTTIEGDIWIDDNGTVSFFGSLPDPVLTVTRASSGTFQPVIELSVGSTATVQWVDTSDETVLATGLTPSIALATGIHGIRLAASVPADVITLNLGYDASQDAGELANPAYNHPSQYVTQVENVTSLAGLERFLCANTIGVGYTGNLTGSVDFTGMADLQQIELFNANVSAVTLTGCASLVRLCLETCNLTNLDINPVRLTLLDLRAAEQKSGSLTFTPMTLAFPMLWHFCVRDQPVTNAMPMHLIPMMRQYWAWNCGLTTATVPNTTQGESFKLEGNDFTADAVDNILGGLEANSISWSDGEINLTGSSAPSATGLASASALTTAGWTVMVEGGATLLWSDTFNRANASGFAAVGNGWAVEGGDIDIVSNTLRRTGSSYCISYNPTNVTLPADLRLEIDVVLDGGEGATAGWLGIAVKYNLATGDGIKALLQAWNPDVDSEIRIGTSADPFSTETVTLDASIPVAGWAADGTHTLALEVVGSMCSVYFDDVLIAHATYTPSTPGVNVALVGDPGQEDIAIDEIRVYGH